MEAAQIENKETPPDSAARVLIVGAGPTGLVLALGLARRGVRLRIIDKNGGPGQASRAMAVHARTLEFYQQFGFADEVVANGVKIEVANIRKDGTSLVKIGLKNIGEGLSPFPFVLSYPQDDHERFLVEKLKAAGVAVEWGVELKEFTQAETHVRALFGTGAVEEVCEAAYLCGCDGAHSRVRQSLQLGFPGGTYANLFFVADVKIDGGFRTDLLMNLGAGGFVLMLPVRSSGMQRLIGLVPEDLSSRADLTFEEVRGFVEPLLHFRVATVNWFATYHVHHRVADHFRAGRCFLAGDAGHIHSPAGGQGMNTGIGDAANLGWKLANVLQGRADPSILNTYETERIAFARKLVATTDKVFQMMTGRGIGSRLFRTVLVPALAPILSSFEIVRRTMFRTISQIGVNYIESAISSGKAGRLRGGDRLPWVRSEDGDNFATLRSLDWQLHVYGEATAHLSTSCEKLDLPLKEFPWSNAAAKAGLQRDAAYLVRPDGYIAFASAGGDRLNLNQYVEKLGIKFRRDV